MTDDADFEEFRRKRIRKDAPIKRNLPHINATIYQHQENWLREMANTSGINYARILREVIECARRAGYTPGSITVRDLTTEAHMGRHTY